MRSKPGRTAGKNGAEPPKTLPSRNSAYDLHRDPEIRRLRRAQRLLAAIGRDLARPGVRATLRARAVLVGGAERVRLEYEHPLMHLSRTAFLTPSELDGLRALLSSSHHLIRWLED